MGVPRPDGFFGNCDPNNKKNYRTRCSALLKTSKENILFDAPNFVATPHLGAATIEAQENVAIQIAQQMSDYLNTGAVVNALNYPSVSAEEAPILKPYVRLAYLLSLIHI